ncbi:MAG: hypothetical protein AMS19_04295 [Gemmatimonas sp. SG8_23]|nr:MAG: hypothetical protein AMS19_04295 [Gemmatimonas sp. SG8_23]
MRCSVTANPKATPGGSVVGMNAAPSSMACRASPESPTTSATLSVRSASTWDARSTRAGTRNPEPSARSSPALRVSQACGRTCQATSRGTATYTKPSTSSTARGRSWNARYRAGPTSGETRVAISQPIGFPETSWESPVPSPAPTAQLSFEAPHGVRTQRMPTRPRTRSMRAGESHPTP